MSTFKTYKGPGIMEAISCKKGGAKKMQFLTYTTYAWVDNEEQKKVPSTFNICFWERTHSFFNFFKGDFKKKV